MVVALLLEEVDTPVAEDLSGMAQTPVCLLLEVGIAAQLAADIPHGDGALLADGNVLFSKMGSAVAGGLEKSKVTCPAEIGIEGPG